VFGAETQLVMAYPIKMAKPHAVRVTYQQN